MLQLSRWSRQATQCFLGSHSLHKGSAIFTRYDSSVPFMEISQEVANAVSMGKPVVALETTLVTHGMPYPDNINTALDVEEIVRSCDVVPATVGVLDGKIHVGMSCDQLTRLAESARLGGVVKVSRRDIAHTLSQGLSGGTTVAATMMCANKAGVQIFVTGGLGGVHRGGEKSMDVSADIMELGRTPVTVVCAGVKSILDIGRTLEALETQGVAVATFGNSTDFPAFFTPTSGFKAPFNVESPTTAAKLIDASLKFGMGSGVVIAVSIPDQYSAEGSEIETAIQEALQSAESEGIEGKKLTPYILQRVNEFTCGKSLKSNISLIKNNAQIGSYIAIELARLKSHNNKTTEDNNDTTTTTTTIHRRQQTSMKLKGQPVVVGASILDFVAKVTTPEIKSEGTNPGKLRQAFGGVARNVAESMCRSGVTPFFISAVGDDVNGQSIVDALREIGMCVSGIFKSPSISTASYCVLLSSQGEMTCGVGDMDIHSTITPEWVSRYESRLRTASIVCVDGNLSLNTIQYICKVCQTHKIPVWFEPTAVDKATVLSQDVILDSVCYISPNLAELRCIHDDLFKKHCGSTIGTPYPPISDLSLDQKLEECCSLIPVIIDHHDIPHVLASLGKDGVVWGRKEGGRKRLSHFSIFGQPTYNHPINVSGAGDSFVGGMLACLAGGLTHEQGIKAGIIAANLSVLTMSAVSSDLYPHLLTPVSLERWGPCDPVDIYYI